MEDTAVNKVDFRVLLARPPSGPTDRRKIVSEYTRQLSSAAAKNYKSVSPESVSIDQYSSGENKQRRPHSAKSKLYRSDNNDKSNITKQNPRQVVSASAVPDIEPNVYGFNSGKLVCGTADPSISLEAQLRTQDRMTHNRNSSFIPEKKINGKYEIPMPNTLQQLKPWITPALPTDWTGIAGSDCYIFLPSMLRLRKEHLPLVPPIVSHPDKELEYDSIVPAEDPWVQKKYDHPSWRKKKKNSWVCDHSNHRHLKVYTSDGNLLHESHRGIRSAQVVRQEIQELEDLMRGFGTPGGSSLIVQYQAEITELQEMISNTLGRVEEIEQREREREKKLEVPDTTGLKEFYSLHDEVMDQIRRQHRECVRELAQLEEDLQLDTHFRNRLQQDGDETTE